VFALRYSYKTQKFFLTQLGIADQRV